MKCARETRRAALGPKRIGSLLIVLRLGVVLAALTFVFSGTTVVLAHGTLDNMYPTAYYTGSYCYQSNACQADNAISTVYFEGNLGNGAGFQTRNRMAHYSSVSDVSFSEVSSPIYSAGSNGETDVIVRNRVLSGSTIGRVFCEDYDGLWDVRCDQHYLDLDVPQFGTISSTVKQRVTCHELGHTLGLKHGSASEDTSSGSSQAGSDIDPALACMVTPSTHSNAKNFVGAHNKHMINSTY